MDETDLGHADFESGPGARRKICLDMLQFASQAPSKSDSKPDRWPARSHAVGRAIVEVPPHGASSLGEVYRSAASRLGRADLGSDERTELQKLLAVPEAVRVILDEVERAPREEIVHDVAQTLAMVFEDHPLELPDELNDHRGRYAMIAMVRSLGYVRDPRTRQRRVALLASVLRSSDDALRDAAAVALRNVGDRLAIPALTEAQHTEKNELVLESIREALDDLEQRLREKHAECDGLRDELRRRRGGER